MSTFTHYIAEKPTPLLNTPEYEKIFGARTLPLDSKGLLRAVEAVALPQAKFTLLKEISPTILEVKTEDYPLSPLYIDKRFVKPVESSYPNRERKLPRLELIFSKLIGSLNLPYLWGGNWSRGISEINTFYSPAVEEKELFHPARTFKGVDCSGLLYEATNGYTPRNTSDLFSFGEQIFSHSNVKPLDILLTPGHVVIVLDATTTIESAYGKGVILSSLNTHLNNHPLIRRFI